MTRTSAHFPPYPIRSGNSTLGCIGRGIGRKGTCADKIAGAELAGLEDAARHVWTGHDMCRIWLVENRTESDWATLLV